MAKELFNRSPRKKVLRLKVNGLTIREDIPAHSSRTLEFLNDFSEIVNRRDRVILEKIESGEVTERNVSGKHLIHGVGLRSASAPSIFVDNIYSNLSEQNRVEYDRAVMGDFIEVTEEEYKTIGAATRSGQYGMTHEQMESEQEDTFAANLYTTFSDATNPNGAVPAGSYIIGFSMRLVQFCSSHTARLYTSTSLAQTNNTFIQIGSDINVGATTPPLIRYYIRKSPQTPEAAKKYFALWVSQNSRPMLSINYPILYSSNNRGWTNWTASAPQQQMLAAPTKTWL
jgi:hypothetical protein